MESLWGSGFRSRFGPHFGSTPCDENVFGQHVGSDSGKQPFLTKLQSNDFNLAPTIQHTSA